MFLQMTEPLSDVGGNMHWYKRKNNTSEAWGAICKSTKSHEISLNCLEFNRICQTLLQTTLIALTLVTIINFR